MSIACNEVGPVLGGAVVWPLDQTRQVLRFYDELAHRRPAGPGGPGVSERCALDSARHVGAADGRGGPGGAVAGWTAMGRWRDRGSEIREVSIVTRLRCRMFVSSALALGVPCSPRWRCPSASRVAQDRDRMLGDADIPP